MKFIIFAALFMAMMALTTFGKGLEITEMEVRVDYNEAYTYQLENKEKIDSVDGLANNSRIGADVFPGNNVTFTVRMGNTLVGSGPENRIRNAFVKIIIADIDAGSDLDGESDNFELEGGDDTLIDLKFSLPLGAATGTYDVFIDAEGEGRNGTFYFTENKLKLEVKKLGHDIQIVKYQLNPSILVCSNRKTKISAEIMNLGSNVEDDVALEFKSNDLGINSIDKGISLESSNDANDEDKKYTKILPLEVLPSISPGVYPILINLYWRGFILFDRKILNLDLRDCGSATFQNQTVQNTNQNTESIPNQTIHTENNNSADSIHLSQNISISSTPILIWIVMGAFVVFILLIVIIFGYSRKNK